MLKPSLVRGDGGWNADTIWKPKGMIEAEENQRFYQEGLLALAQVALNMKNMQSQSMSVSQQKEDKE